MWGWWSLVSDGDHVSHAAPSPAPPAGGGASAAICFRLPINHGRNKKAISKLSRIVEGLLLWGTGQTVSGRGGPQWSTASRGLARTIAYTVLSYRFVSDLKNR